MISIISRIIWLVGLWYLKRRDILYQKPKNIWLQGARDSKCVPQSDDISGERDEICAPWRHDMTQERTEKNAPRPNPSNPRERKEIRRNPTQATQESEKKSGGSERKQLTFWLTLFTLRSSRFLFALLGCLCWVAADFFSLSWVAWVGSRRIFFGAFLGHIMSSGSTNFVAFPRNIIALGNAFGVACPL